MTRALKEAEMMSREFNRRKILERKIEDLEKENKQLKEKLKIEIRYACAYRTVLKANGLLESTHKWMEKGGFYGKICKL